MTRPVEFDPRPTRLSVATAVVSTLGTAWLLADAAGLTRQVRYSATGAVLLGAILWLLADDRWALAGAALAGLLLPVVGLGLLAGTGYTVSAQLRNVLPVGAVFLVAGATVAVFGAVGVVRDVIRREPLVRCLTSGFRSLAVIGAALTLGAIAQFGLLSGDGPVGTLVSVLLNPHATPPLASFLVALLAAIFGVRGATKRLPVVELFGDEFAPDTRRLLASIDRWLALAVFPLAAAALVATFLELRPSPAYGWLPGGVAGLLGVVMTPLRWLLGGIALVSAVAIGLSVLLRGTYQRSARETLTAVAPYCSGLVVAAGSLWYHDQFLSAVTRQVEWRLPPALVMPYRNALSDAVDAYGEPIVALLVVTVLLVAALVAVALVLLTVRFGLDERAGGAAVAGTGLFTTTVFAAVVGVPLWITLVGAVAAVFVWDVGEFGATLGRELGTAAATARTELSHGGGTLLVGAGVVTTALALDGLAGRVTTTPTASVVALVGAVVGVLLLVAASR